MRIAIGSDEVTQLTEFVTRELKSRGLEVELHGALAPGDDTRWPQVARRVAERVSQGSCHQGILLCWTGTGVSIAANKVPGVRAALCTDAATAAGARRWNNANVLAMGLRLTSTEIAREMLDAWFSTNPETGESADTAAMVTDIEIHYMKAQESSPHPVGRR
ncbi:MAG: RpiB/LacA/LacB family sugar-phosphate isomerase [Chloroflexi bacterium]|nr:RpiB/LacA/LacB family sugar-phosphate isomerase [Chloroflexota bacterium]